MSFSKPAVIFNRVSSRPLAVLFRRHSKLVKEQDPEEVENLPVFQYATEHTKRTKRVYMWGNSMFGALGSSSFLMPVNYRSPLKTMHKPWRLPFSDFHKVRDIACGYGFTVIAASNEENGFSLFGTGLNGDFQLGYQCNRKNHPLETIVEPVPITLPLVNQSTKVQKIACGRAHTVAVTDKEGVFSLGNNAYGQCGVPPSKPSAKDFIKVNKVEGISEEISQVICGQDHTLFMTTAGQVYSCGWGADGQTGLGHYDNQGVPSKVKGDIEGEKIIQMSCAADCTIAVSDKGDVFGWGNSEYGQLNLVTDQQQINVARHLKLKNVGKITQVASGGTMCAILNENGDVYVWGYGILGQGPNVTHLEEPSLLERPLFGINQFNTDDRVQQLSCGLSHFAAVTKKGMLYMWGRNRSNCLGLGRETDQFFPFKVCVPAEVMKISCGVDHTAALCRSFA